MSAGLKELQGWQVIEGSRQLGDRKEYFTAPRDMIVLARAVIAARHEREVAPYRAALDTQMAAASRDGTPAPVLARLPETARVMDALANSARQALDHTPTALAAEAESASPGDTAKPKKKRKKTN